MTFGAFGWDVVRKKYGKLRRAAFAEPGGKTLKAWIDRCSNQEYSVLTFMGGALWHQLLLEDLGDQGDVAQLLKRLSDVELASLMETLGGNRVDTMTEIFASIDHDRPTCFIAHTTKGWGTPIAGHKDNHSGLMNTSQFARWQAHMGVPPGAEWDRFATVGNIEDFQAFLARVPVFRAGRRRRTDAPIPVPAIALPVDSETPMQKAFWKDRP